MLKQSKETSIPLLSQFESSALTEILAGWRAGLVVFIVAFAMIVSRRPDSIFNPQFYAEDGATWFIQAYDLGAIKALFVTYAGYLHFFPRIFAGLAVALNINLLHVPLFLNIIAIIAKIVPVLFFLSPRLPFSMVVKLYVSFLYLAMPAAWEVHANISNAYVHLALLSFLILIARPASSRAGKIFDIGTLVLGALTGPFCIFLVPVAACCWYQRRERSDLINGLTLVVFSFAQGILILQHRSSPSQIEPIDSLLPLPEEFFKTLFNQLWLAGILGIRLTNRLISAFSPTVWSWLATLSCAIALGVLVYLLIKGPTYLRLFIYFASILILVSLWSSINRMGATWEIMNQPGAGGRYFFIPSIAYVVSLVYLLGKGHPKAVRYGSGCLLCLMSLGVVTGWVMPPFQDFDFPSQVEAFNNLPPGATYTFEIVPPGWSFEMMKR